MISDSLFRLTVFAAAILCLYTPNKANAQAPAQKTFRAGAATSNITPPLGVSINGNMHDRPAKHIHDELHARCIVLDDGATRLAIVVADSCMIYRETFDAAKRLVEERTALPAKNMLMSATHTHSAPAAVGVFQSDANKDYQTFLTSRLADAVQRAINNLEPAQIGWASATEPNQVFNRRWKMKPGTVLRDPFGGTNDLVKMNPPHQSPDLLEPAGPIDPEIPVVAIRAADGRPIALLANYSLHYCGGTGSGVISADYFGAFCDRIQQLIGADRLDPPFVAMLSNGASGDCNNIDFTKAPEKESPFARIRRVANAVADAAFSAYQRIEYRGWVPLNVAQTEAEFALRLPSENEISEAKARLVGTENSPLKTIEEIYARETILLSEFPPSMPLLLQTLRIGDLGIAAVPCEVFAEIGLELKAKSPLQPAFTISLANGYNGYLPTPAQHTLGGYETWRARSSYLERDASPRIIELLLELFGQLADSR